MLRNRDYLEYTYRHRRALRYCINACKYLSDDEKFDLFNRAETHDCDKMMMYLFWNKNKASKVHREYASHHLTKVDGTLWSHKVSKLNILESIFDFECAALTKLDKPLNAYDTILKFYAQVSDIYMPYLKRLNMNYSYHFDYVEK